MCNCMSTKIQELKDKFGYEYVLPPVEMLSGRAYLEFTIKEKDKKKEKTMSMLLAKCPFCGEEYESK